MSKSTPRPAGTAASSVAPPRNGPEPQADKAGECDDAFFDAWLKLELHDTFDAVAAEPIPEDLLHLIREDRGERERIRRSRARGGGA